jgi:hypothetical protein
MLRSLIVALLLAASLSVAGSAQQDIQTAQLSLVPVQGNVHLLVGAGPNIAVQVGGDGIVLVDTPPPGLLAQVQEQLRTLSRLLVRYILNTSMDLEHVSGNAAFVPAPARGTGGAPFGALGLARPAIIAHEAVLNRLSSPPAGQPAVPPTALPTTTYYLPSMDFHVNGEPVFLYHQANAHNRDRRWHADTPASLRRSAAAGWTPNVAGLLGRPVGESTAASGSAWADRRSASALVSVPGAARSKSSPRRSAPATFVRTGFHSARTRSSTSTSTSSRSRTAPTGSSSRRWSPTRST